VRDLIGFVFDLKIIRNKSKVFSF